MTDQDFTPEDAAVEKAESYADEHGWPKHHTQLGELENPEDIATTTEFGPLG